MKSEDLMRNFNEALAAEIENVDKTLLPVLRVYVDSVRDIRMVIGREVQDILRTSRTLNEITKITPELMDLASALERLQKVMTPEFLSVLSRLTKE